MYEINFADIPSAELNKMIKSSAMLLYREPDAYVSSLSNSAIKVYDTYEYSEKAEDDYINTLSFNKMLYAMVFNLLRIKNDLIGHIRKACKKARSENAKAQMIEVMLRDKGFRVITQKIKLDIATNQEIEIIPIAIKLLNQLYSPVIVWRSVGITLLNLIYDDVVQNDLFNKPKKSDDRLGKVLDNLEKKFGKDIIKIGK